MTTAISFLTKLFELEKRLHKHVEELDAHISTHVELRVHSAACLEFDSIEACTEVITTLERAKETALAQIDQIKVKKLLVQEQSNVNSYAKFRNAVLIKALS